MVLDGASWHRSKDLAVPSNIRLVCLPPYSPDLNPIEHFWSWLKAWIRRLNLPHLHITQKIEKVFRKLEV